MDINAPILIGTAVELAPMTMEDAPMLREAAGGPETFRWFTTPPDPWSVDGFRGYCRRLLNDPTIRPYTVRLRHRDGQPGTVVGSTTYCDLRPGHRGVEIGWTWYGPAHRGLRVNPACKLLLLTHAFGGGLFGTPAIRVCLKTDARNKPSRGAILKLGAAFEGILRSHVIMPDGHRRDSAMYSIIEAEWPAVERGLRDRLGG